MTDNVKIGNWLGLDRRLQPPDFTGSDAAAISLLPVLVKRGYTVTLEDVRDDMVDKSSHQWRFAIYQREPWKELAEIHHDEISLSITAAVTALIDKEARG